MHKPPVKHQKLGNGHSSRTYTWARCLASPPILAAASASSQCAVRCTSTSSSLACAPPLTTPCMRHNAASGQILTMRRLTELSRSNKRPLYAGFIEYQKTFDCINRSALWVVLASRHVDPHHLTLLRDLYDGCEGEVAARGQVSAIPHAHWGPAGLRLVPHVVQWTRPKCKPTGSVSHMPWMANCTLHCHPQPTCP